jgi:hypothetical protein
MEAKERQCNALEGCRGVLGEEHPRTLEIMDNLALVLQNQGKYAGAQHMHRHTLKLMEKGFGEEHPKTKRCRDNLASCLQAEEEARKRG